MTREAKIKWAAFLTEEESTNATQLIEYLKSKGVLPKGSRYGLVKYLISWAYNIMLQEIEDEYLKEKTNQLLESISEEEELIVD